MANKLPSSLNVPSTAPADFLGVSQYLSQIIQQVNWWVGLASTAVNDLEDAPPFDASGLIATDANLQAQITAEVNTRLTNDNALQIQINQMQQQGGLAQIAYTGSATDLVAGIVPTARVSGPYTGITGVGVLTLGTWQATTVEAAYGGTGHTSYTDGQLLIGNTGTTALDIGTLTQPAAGITISNGPGTITFALANDLAAVEGLSTTGLATRTALDTWTTRSLAQPAAGITISNSDGVAGNPTFALANDLAALEAMSSTGLVSRTASETYAQRTLQQPAAGITITNPAGIAGDPTFALANDLAALEAMSGTGLVARTASETYAQRTITGTAARISISNGDGVAGNPTIDIDATYVGQTSITTLGTVTTGTWNATVVAGQYGGTGVANTGKTITLGGNLTTSGAFNTTLTVTADTNSTLPSGTHTLAGLDVAQTWSANQQFNSGNFILKGATSGTLTVKPAAVAGSNTLTLPAGTTDFSATGGTSQVVKQTSAGGAFTVAQLAASDLSNGTTGSGAVVLANTPSLITPDIGAATGTSLTVTGLLQAGTTLGISTDVLLNRTGANSLALRNGTNAQTWRVYNTYTDASNGEWWETTWSSNVATLGTNQNGSGVARAVAFRTGGTEATRITTSQEFLIGVTSASAKFQIGGTYTTSNLNFIQIAGTHNSSSTSTHTGMTVTTAFLPSGASVASIIGAFYQPSISGSATLNCSSFSALTTQIRTTSGYSGTITNGNGLSILGSFTGSGNNPYTNIFGINIAAETNGNGITSGAVVNTGLNVAAFTAAAGAGGTITNTAVKLSVPSSSAAGNTDRALWITGNGGASSTKYAIYSDSTAASQLAGALTVTATGSSLADQIYDHDVICTSQLDKTSNTTLATVTGLSLALVAGKTYRICGWLSTTAGASGGLKVALVASGGLTATSCRFVGFSWNGTTAVANTTVTALGSNIVANTAVVTDVFIEGSIVVNAAGTINVQAAQNASNGTTTSVFAGSTFTAKRIN